LTVAADDKSDTETTETPTPGTDLTKTETAETETETEAAESETETEDTDGAVDSETASTEADPQRATPGRRRALWIGVAAAVLVAALGGAGFLGWKLWDLSSVASAGRQAQDAAVAYAQVLTSIDSNKVDENFTQVLDGATGEFKDMYSQSSVQLRQLLIDNKASAHGVVVDSAVQSATRDKVVVLLFVDQSVSNTNVPDPRIDRSRIKMTMEHVDDRWRASKVELP
jgi:Mce-associated membrane protein